MLSSAQKPRHLSQSSENRTDTMTNGTQKLPSDEGSNPLKRRNTETGVDYPRRRATIAVRCDMNPLLLIPHAYHSLVRGLSFEKIPL